MKSGRSTRSGSVVYSSRTKRVNELPVTLSSSSPTRPARSVAARGVPSSRSGPQLGDAVIVVRAPVQRALQLVEAQLATGQAQRGHVVVGLEEPAPELGEEALERRAVVAQAVAQDEVLHRVGRDDGAVVALGVGGQEVVAEHLDVDLDRHQGVLAPGERRLGHRRDARERRAVGPVHRHGGLAVGDGHALHAGSSSRSCRRSDAILTTSSSAVSSSCSALWERRRAKASRMVGIVCSRTHTTNGNPKRSR